MAVVNIGLYRDSSVFPRFSRTSITYYCCFPLVISSLACLLYYLSAVSLHLKSWCSSFCKVLMPSSSFSTQQFLLEVGIKCQTKTITEKWSKVHLCTHACFSLPSLTLLILINEGSLKILVLCGCLLIHGQSITMLLVNQSLTVRNIFPNRSYLF